MQDLARFAMTANFGAMGACIGSFMNLALYRLPIMINGGREVRRWFNLRYPRSACPECGVAIRGRDNVPLISFVTRRGRCFGCQTPIPRRYFVVEMIGAASFLYAGWSLTSLDVPAVSRIVCALAVTIAAAYTAWHVPSSAPRV